MNGREFIRRAKRYARKTGKEYHFDQSQGKGSHGTLYIGTRRATVMRDELKSGTFRNMLKQLGINKEDF